MNVEGTHETLPSILLVDDDEVLRERLATAIRARGYEVRTAGSADEALREAARESPEMAVLDLRMPGGGGLDLLKELRRHDPATRVLMLTGYGSISTAVEAVREGAVGYLPKPADADEILAALNGTNTAKQSGVETPSLARAEWEHIQRVLTDCGGNISEAARRLGIHRRSLQRKLHKYPPSR
ncbi:response regulator transcription factor [Anaeromyxobacter terrae]|uniref:response regulator transcription factor n=1 Tax=Anaeromyxobacter terrae TaxID=2925406 RepID=UPI001F55CEC6|nr:response regulator [Anaeromyxobacter sp. SG22]